MLVIRPTMKKTIVKGTILILVFSSFLDVSRVVNFLIFLALAFLTLLVYAFWKRAHEYTIAEDSITISSPLEKRKIPYSSIADHFVSVGFLAKRFHVGSVYLILKDTRVEILRDIPDPESVEKEIEKYANDSNK